MPNRQYELSVDSGKYTFIVYEGDYRIHVQRYGTPWLIIEKGHNAVWSLLVESIDNKNELEKLRKLSEGTQDCADCADKASDGFDSPFAE